MSRLAGEKFVVTYIESGKASNHKVAVKERERERKRERARERERKREHAQYACVRACVQVSPYPIAEPASPLCPNVIIAR